jgi:hypothetical protein
MKSDMGLLMNIVLGIVGAAVASAILSFFGIALGGCGRGGGCWCVFGPDPTGGAPDPRPAQCRAGGYVACLQPIKLLTAPSYE